MSQYLNIYLKTSNNEVIHLASYSRNHPIYKEINAPYEDWMLYTVNEWCDLSENFEAMAEKYKRKIQDAETFCYTISNFAGNSLDEKIDKIAEIKQHIKEDAEEKDFYLKIAGEAYALSRIASDNNIYLGVELDMETVRNIGQ